MTNSLLTKEVTDFHLLTLLINGNVDGEVSVHKTHLVTIAVSNTGNHVLDVGADGTNNGNVLVETKPQINDDLTVLLANINKLVGEVTAESATRSLNYNASVLNENFD